ncbi:hypothetical protein J3458_001911 [Metarhizium acridum]|uniref:uncharacterized protein n=1 Tax=Metarhizium acridum TaxID=92637 RepID=UPI001C6CD5A2|nr:hypothetical protein J3458_001911 [Metarhizium acridum]
MMEEPSTLPQTSEPISRPSSTSTSVSANLQQLPAISALAVSNAAQSPPQLRATAAPQNPTYTGATPPAATNGNGNGNGNLVSLLVPRSFNTPIANTGPPNKPERSDMPILDVS